jgi:hypothetical protein
MAAGLPGFPLAVTEQQLPYIHIGVIFILVSMALFEYQGLIFHCAICLLRFGALFKYYGLVL